MEVPCQCLSSFPAKHPAVVLSILSSAPIAFTEQRTGRDDEEQVKRKRKSRWMERRRYSRNNKREGAGGGGGEPELPLSKDTVFYSLMNTH